MYLVVILTSSIIKQIILKIEIKLETTNYSKN